MCKEFIFYLWLSLFLSGFLLLLVAVVFANSHQPSVYYDIMLYSAIVGTILLILTTCAAYWFKPINRIIFEPIHATYSPNTNINTSDLSEQIVHPVSIINYKNSNADLENNLYDVCSTIPVEKLPVANIVKEDIVIARLVG